MLLKERFFSVYSVFLVLLLYSVHFFDEMYLFYILIVGIFFIILKPIYILPVYFISSLSGSFFNMPNEIGTVSRYLFLILLISLSIQLFKNERTKKKIIINDALLVFIIIFNLISSITSLSGSFNTFFLMLQNLLIFYLLSRYKTKDVSIFLKTLFLSALLVIILILLEIYAQGINILLIKYRYSINKDVNQNRFAMMLVQLGIIVMIPVFINLNFKKIKIFSLLSFPIIIILLVLTGSRTGLISYLLTVLLGYLFVNNKINIKNLVLFLGLFIIFYFTWDFLTKNIFFMYRFTLDAESRSSGISNRLYSISHLLNFVIPHNPFFGVGLGGENTVFALKSFGTNIKSAHNLVIDLLAQIGLVGALLYFFLLKSIFKSLFLLRNKYTILYFPFLLILAALFNGFGETIFFEKFFWNNLAIGVLILNNLNYIWIKNAKFNPSIKPT